MDRYLVYVSLKTPHFFARPNATDEIVAVARSRNSGLGVTGAFIETATNFAQILEGSGPALDALMDSIDRDPRHSDVTLLIEQPIERRRLGDWSMAYSGTSSWVANQITPLISADLPRAPHRIERLEALLVGFAMTPVGKIVAQR